MLVCRTIAEFRAARATISGSLGFVPTMGYLHEGHLALIAAARGQNAAVAASIFVNPTQFNNPDDLAAYPRDEARDLAMLQTGGVDLVFIPPAEEMYPPNFQTYVTVETLTQGLEGAARPGHFRGVATVVTKLFNIVQPTRAYFGQKDAQQVAVIRQMVRDLAQALEIVVCETLREHDGLAMSSRNARLTEVERAAAGVLYQALNGAALAFENGERNPDSLRGLMRDLIEAEPLAKIDYISAADADRLEELHQPISPETRILFSLAVWIGKTRLIDNFLLQ